MAAGSLKNDANLTNSRTSGPERLAHIGVLLGKTITPVTDLKAGDIGACVEAVSRLGVQRRLQQADLVVVVQRADRQTRPPGQLTDLQAVEAHP